MFWVKIWFLEERWFEGREPDEETEPTFKTYCDALKWALDTVHEQAPEHIEIGLVI